MSTRSKRKNNLILLRSHSSGIRNRESGEGHVGQVDLEELLLRRREVMELEERIALALSKGARVETGVHTAELVPERRHSAGRELFLKLVILIFFFAVLPAVCSPVGLIEDVNGDGKIDMLDFIESSAALPSGKGAAF